MRWPLFSAPLLLSGCLKASPDHCANNEGDASCASGFCSRCTDENRGCVFLKPSTACWTPLDSVTEASSEGGSSSSGGPAAECEEHLAQDPSCPKEESICFEGSCSTCVEAGGNDACRAVDAARPICTSFAETCIGCLPQDPQSCEQGSVCGRDFECKPCLEHEDCTTACDLQSNTCIESPTELWIDNVACAAEAEARAGSEDDPACTLQEALKLAAGADSAVFHLIGGSDRSRYEVLDLDTSPEDIGTLVLLGSDFPELMGLNNTDQSVRLMAKDLEIVGDGQTFGVICQGVSEIWLDDTVIRNAKDGFVASRCRRARLRRVQILDNSGDGLRALDSNLRVESSIIARNGSEEDGAETVGVELEGGITVLRYTTIAANVGGRPSADKSGVNLFCITNAEVSGRNNVIVSEPLGSIRCPSIEDSLTNSFIDTDTDGLRRSNVVTTDYTASWFENVGDLDFRIRFGGTSPFAGVAIRTEGDPVRDIDGVVRLTEPGEPDFAGADQP